MGALGSGPVQRLPTRRPPRPDHTLGTADCGRINTLRLTEGVWAFPCFSELGLREPTSEYQLR